MGGFGDSKKKGFKHQAHKTPVKKAPKRQGHASPGGGGENQDSPAPEVPHGPPRAELQQREVQVLGEQATGEAWQILLNTS